MIASVVAGLAASPGGQCLAKGHLEEPPLERLAPRGVPHAYRVGDTPARALVLSSPGGFEAFVRAVASLPEVDPGALAVTATEHGIEILGPPGTLPG